MSSSQPIYEELRAHLDTLPIGFPKTSSGVEIRILQQLFSPFQAQIAVQLSILPMSAHQLLKRIRKRKVAIKISEEELEQELEILGNKGAIMMGKRGETPMYSNAMLAIGMFEFQGDFITKEFAADMLQYMDEGFRDEFFNSPPSQLRPIPSIGIHPPEYPIATYDDIRKIIGQVTGSITIFNCICKISQDQLGHPCQVTDERMWCMSFSYNPQETLDDHPSFHKEKKILTKEEALARINDAEKAGLVLQPSNSKKPLFLCMCCGDCCGVLTQAKKLPHPANYFHSNYQIAFHEELCIGCQICVNRCQMEAISFTDGRIHVAMDRCIGCGLCATTCKPQALTLIRKSNHIVPAKNTLQLYLKILQGKMGRIKAYRMLLHLFFESLV